MDKPFGSLLMPQLLAWQTRQHWALGMETPQVLGISWHQLREDMAAIWCNMTIPHWAFLDGRILFGGETIGMSQPVKHWDPCAKPQARLTSQGGGSKDAGDARMDMTRFIKKCQKKSWKGVWYLNVGWLSTCFFDVRWSSPCGSVLHFTNSAIAEATGEATL